MARGKKGKRCMLQVGPQYFSHPPVEIRIAFAPNYFYRFIECFCLGIANGVSGDLLIELRGHLRERGTGAMLPKIVVNHRAQKGRVTRLLVLQQTVLKLLALPVENPPEMLRAL